MAWEPNTGALWTVVNERDGLGDETPPDYLTSVRDGGFYGWPYRYWGQIVDDRVPQDPAMVAKAITPDYALGGHTASLGLCWLPAGTLPGFPDGMASGQHGSWNRSTLSGYKLVFVPFAGGRPAGPSGDILSGFLAPDEKVSYGRPVGVAIGPDGYVLMGRRCDLARDRHAVGLNVRMKETTMLQVKWDDTVCIHSANCVKKLPNVFKVENGQFVIDESRASEDAIRTVVAECPSGALKLGEK
jgi:uncharacterized Fe-S cluster protein YjdI